MPSKSSYATIFHALVRNFSRRSETLEVKKSRIDWLEKGKGKGEDERTKF